MINKNPRNILILWKGIFAGSGMAIKPLLYIKAKNLRFDYYSFEKPLKIDQSLKKIKFINNFSIFYLSPSIKKILLFIKNVFSVYSLFRKKKYEAALVGDIYSLTVVHLVKKILGNNTIQVIFRVGSPVSSYIKIKPYIWYRNILFKIINKLILQTHYFIFNSYKSHKDLESNFKIKKGSKFYVINNGIDLKEIDRLTKGNISQKEIGFFTKSGFNIVSIGRLVKEKDYITGIKAFKKIVKIYPNCKFFIIGDGPLFEDIRNYIMRLGLNKNIYLLGWKSNVFPYLKRADIFIQSSIYEGFGYAILEAMTQGIPVISTDSPFGPAEILDNGKYGILVPVGNAQEMTKAIIKLIRNKRQYYYFANKSKLRSRYFLLNESIKKYQSVFKDVLINIK